jgi:hypothetical protein
MFRRCLCAPVPGLLVVILRDLLFICKIMDSGWARTWFLLNFGIVIGVIWLITLGLGGGGGGKIDRGC